MCNVVREREGYAAGKEGGPGTAAVCRDLAHAVLTTERASKRSFLCLSGHCPRRPLSACGLLAPSATPRLTGPAATLCRSYSVHVTATSSRADLQYSRHVRGCGGVHSLSPSANRQLCPRLLSD